LQPTIDDILAKAEGSIEIIVYLDEFWSDPPLKDDPRVTIVHHSKRVGMRPAINAAVSVARGKYIMKLDAHCMLDEGFDTVLKADCEPDWIVVPRRKRLDAEKWCIQKTNKPDIDAMYLSYPEGETDFGGVSLHGRLWTQRTLDRKDILIDDELSFQGSSWFMHRDYYHRLELMNEIDYGYFYNEAQEIGLKAWLSGGRVVRNKKTWYAHLHKGRKYGRGYYLSKSSINKSAKHTRKWMTYGAAWAGQTKPLSWLIERFMPVPTWDEEKIAKLKETGN
jgi:glycosyltransferase involved in cell wall biosynthesis